MLGFHVGIDVDSTVGTTVVVVDGDAAGDTVMFRAGDDGVTDGEAVGFEVGLLILPYVGYDVGLQVLLVDEREVGIKVG